MTGCPCNLGETPDWRGHRPGLLLPSCVSAPLPPPNSSPRELPPPTVGRGATGGRFPPGLCVHHTLLLGRPRDLASGYNFPLLIIRIPGNRLSCHRPRGIFPPGLRRGQGSAARSGHCRLFRCAAPLAGALAGGARPPSPVDEVWNFVTGRKHRREAILAAFPNLSCFFPIRPLPPPFDCKLENT